MKEQIVIQLVHDMPEEIELDELIYRLHLEERLDQADAAAEAGDVIPHDEVERELEHWSA